MNAESVRAAARAGDFCDVGHYYCPHFQNGSLVFPSGVLRADGTFHGAERLREMLSAIPADYRPEPVAVIDRYPSCSEQEAARRCCACGD